MKTEKPKTILENSGTEINGVTAEFLAAMQFVAANDAGAEDGEPQYSEACIERHFALDGAR